MKNIVPYLLLCVISFGGCKKDISHKYVELDEFSSSYDITGESICLGTEIFFPKEMLLLNDTTIALVGRGGEFGVKVLKINQDSIRLITDLGRIGGGPNDVTLGVSTLQQDSYDSAEGLWIGDTRTMKFHPYHAETNTWDENPSCIKKLSSNVLPCSRSFVLRDSNFLGISTVIDHLSFIYSPDNDSVTGYDFCPLDPNPYDYLMSKTIYSCDMNLKPDKSHFVLSYELFKSLCIVSLDKLSEPLFLKFKNTPDPQIGMADGQVVTSDLNRLPIQYIDTYTTDRFIYALYVGKMVEELADFSPETSKGMSIHVFNWDGTPYCSFNLDRIINCLCVDETNHIIYGIDPTAEENSAFFKFPMPEHLR